MNRKSLQAIIIPICALLIFALGILIGRNRAIDTAGIEADDKLSRALQLIKEQYVDTVNEDRLMDMALTSLFKSLDPHSEYIPASDLQSVNEDLEGSFSGVGIRKVRHYGRWPYYLGRWRTIGRSCGDKRRRVQTSPRQKGNCG